MCHMSVGKRGLAGSWTGWKEVEDMEAAGSKVACSNVQGSANCRFR
jgi:hypothetical protein